MKQAIYPLYASADESKVRPILDELKAKGGTVRDPGTTPGKGDALLVFLSENVSAQGPEAEAFFRLNPGRALVIPVNLDGCTPPEELQNALLARHALDGRKYSSRELADLIVKAVGTGGSRLPLVLSLIGAAALLLVGGIILWKNLSGQPAEETVAQATEAPTPAPTAAPSPTPEIPLPDFGVDPAEVAEVVYVGNEFRFYPLDKKYLALGNKNERQGASFTDIASDSWDDGPHFYSKQTGQEIPMGETVDLGYLSYLPNLRYLTLVNVKGELPDLSALEKLNQVCIIQCDLPNIEGLRGASMNRFEYHGDTVKDFSPLNDCQKLNYLHLAPWGLDVGASLSELGPAALRELSISGTVTDLSGLRQCTKLQNLELQDAYLEDLACLSGLSLEQLRLNHLDRLTDLHGLENMRTLRILRIQGCRLVRDISALEGCSSLVEVDLSSDEGGYDYLRDVSVLGTLPRLQYIGLYGVNVPDMNFLKELNIKKNINLGFCIGGNPDYSGLAAIDTYSYLHVNTCGNYALAAPYLEGKTVRQLMIYDGGLVDLSTLPNVTGELDLCRCLNRDLSGIPEMSFGDKLWIQDCPYFSSFDGIEHLTGIGRAGSNLTVENCPRLTDWSAIEGKTFSRLELKGVFSLPDLGKVNFFTLALEYLDKDTLPDLSCLNALSENERYSFRFVGMDQITDLSPLFRLRGEKLEVPPQVGEQAQGLVDDKRFKTCEIVYPDGSWDPSDVQVQLMSLDELDTLPPSILKHVKRITIVGDHLVNDDITNYWSDWSQNPPSAVLTDRATGEEIARINAPGTLFTDFSRLSALTGLEDLNLWYQPLTSLEGIQALENLQWLKVEFCPNLTDVSAAFTLQGLKEINFERCPISSLQGVQNLFALEWLQVCNTKITSLEGIEELRHLTMVRLAGTDVKDFSPLSQVDFTYAAEHEGGVQLALNVMNSSQLPADALAFLQNVPVIRRLELYDVPARLWFEYVLNRPVLELAANNSDLTQEQFNAFVAAHPELESLSIPYNGKITDVSALLKLEHCRTLWLSHNMTDAIASLGEGYGFELYIDN